MSTANSAPRLSIVLPAYNEERRLPSTLERLQAFATSTGLDCEVIVVDNASNDGTSAVAQRAMQGWSQLRLMRTEQRGKGLAVRTGVLAARGSIVFFGDADLSWPLEDVERFAKFVSDEWPVVIGSREGHGARRVGEPFYRHYMGRVFNRVVQLLAVPGIEDTQCGFKAFRADAARAIFERQKIRGFGFDVEVLFLARQLGYGICEIPLEWAHNGDSRVDPLMDSLKMLLDVLAVRLAAARARPVPSRQRQLEAERS